MTAKHTQGELRYEPGADGYRRGLPDDSVLICDQMVFGVIYADGIGDFETSRERAARLALRWNMHDRLVDGVRDLVGLIDLLLANRDALPIFRGAIARNHRLVSSLALLAKLDGAK